MRRLAFVLTLAGGLSCSTPTHPLEDTNVHKRREAAILLAEEPALARRQIPWLLRAMSDVDADVRWRAEFALGRVGPDGLPGIIDALHGPDAWAAAYVLGSPGRRARAAMPALREAATSADDRVRLWATHSLRDLERPSPPAAAARREPDDQNFGIYFQWGLYSVPHRARPGEVAERILENEKLPTSEYEKYGANFTASAFDAREWVRVAKDAGARFVALSAKHADGFCLWDTKQTDFNSARACEARRDLVKELSLACDRAGMPFAVSCSIEDRHDPDAEKDLPRFSRRLREEVDELLSYPVSDVWFDGARAAAGVRLEELRAGVRARKPKPLPPGTPDACRTIGTSRGYCDSPDPLKTAERLIDEMVDAVSRGEPFLLAVGPRADGTIPDAFQERLTILGEWLRWNGEAIYGAEASPFGRPIPAGPVTAKGSRLYVFLGERPEGAKIEFPGLRNRIVKAWLLGTNDPVRVVDNALEAPALLDEALTVVAVDLDGPPAVK